MEDKYKYIFNETLRMSNDGFIVVDTEGVVIDISECYSDYLGRPRSWIVGRDIRETIPNTKMLEVVKYGYEDELALHKYVPGYTRDADDDFVLVSRACVRDERGVIIAGIAQVHFRQQMVESAKRMLREYNAMEFYRQEYESSDRKNYTFQNIVGSSERFQRKIKEGIKAAKTNFPVVLTGETGTGKEVFARAIHNTSSRAKMPMVCINCAAIPAELLESELFGYEEGAFTGARKGGRKGKFQLADGGTIFLDEIGEIDKRMQALLLRVLQEKEVRRVGGEKVIPIDVRVIAATNQDLYEAVLDGKFRNDLYFRLSILNIHLPALRKRREDIPLLVESLIGELDRRLGCRVSGVDGEILQVLREYNWPGNVRELRNTLEKIVALTREGVARREAIIPVLQDLYYRQQKHESRAHGGQTIEELERRAIAEALLEENGNRTRAARRLGMDRSTLLRKIERYRIKG